MKNIIVIASLFLIACSSVQTSENSNIAKLLQNKEFVFIAQTAIPARSPSIAIGGGGYDLKMLNDSLSVLLPFYGRSTDISAGRNGGPIELKTKDFSYTVNKKKTRWEVYFVPTGQTPIRQMSLSVSENGYASLQVVSNNRDNMTFNGVVEALTK